MPPTGMQRFAQAAAGICGKISQNRILLSDIRKNSVLIFPKQTGSLQPLRRWTTKSFLILPISANVIRRAEMW